MIRYFSVTELGEWFTEYAMQLFPFFKNEFFAPGLAMAIIAIGLLMACYFTARFLPAGIQLRNCAARLKAYENWEDFSKKFGDFDLYVATKAKILSHGWREFTETVIPPGQGENRPVWITVRPSVYLNTTDAEQRLGLKRFLGWANIFVGVGLLLTFLGLVAALFFAASAIRDAVGTGRDTQQAMQQALVQLLNTATFKFWTSIAGLGCSIGITLLHKFLSIWISSSFSIICNRLEDLTHTVTPEWLANRQYEVIQEQSNQLRTFNDQLAFTLGQSLERAIQQAMPGLMATAMSPVVERLDHLQQSNGPTFEEALGRAMPPVMESAITPLAQQMSNMAENISAANQSTLQSLSQELGNVITANAGAELRELVTTLGEMRETLAASSQHLTGSGGEMSRQMVEATTMLRSVLTAMAKGIVKFSHEAHTDLTRTQEALQFQLNSVGQNLDALSQGINASIVEMGSQLTNSSQQAAEAFSAQIASAVTRIEAAAERGAASLDALVGSLHAAAQDVSGSLTGGSEGAAQTLQDAVERMTKSMEAAARQLQVGASEASGEISTRFLDSMQDIQKLTAQNAIQIREAIDAIVGTSDQARQEVDLAVKQVGVDLGEKGQEAAHRLVTGTDNVMQNLSSTLDGLSLRVNGVVSKMADIEDKLAGHAISLGKLNASARSTADVMAGTAQSLKGATVPLEQAEQGLSRVTDSLKQSVEGVFEKMHPLQEEIKRLSIQTTGTLDRLQNVWGQYERRFEGVDHSLGRTVETIVNNLKGNASSFSEYVKNVDSHLASTVEQLAGNIQELAHTAEELRRATETLRINAR